MNALTVQRPFTDTITWRVIIERRGTHRLHSMRWRADMPIRTVMNEILALYQREQLWLSSWLSQHVVEIATFNTETNVNIESQFNNVQEVYITGRNPSNLTWATHHMSAVIFDTQARADGSPTAILLKPRITHIGMLILAVAVLMAVVVPGVLLGVMVRQADLGVALSAAITGIIALVGKFRGSLV